MDRLAEREIRDFFERLGQRYPRSASLFLLGGGALSLLGSPRRTIDIDYTLVDPSEQGSELVQAVEELANEMQLEVEFVPIGEFVPLPEGAGNRHQLIARFGNLKVFVYDPYTIALSKVARGFEADLQDVVFLLRHGFIDLEKLTAVVETALPVAWDYDIDPQDLLTYLGEVRRLMNQARQTQRGSLHS